MRRFELHRDIDISHVSGTGIVAQGCQYDDGTVALRWISDRPSTTFWASVADVVAVHCHGGLSRIVFLDPEPAFDLDGRQRPNGRPVRYAD